MEELIKNPILQSIAAGLATSCLMFLITWTQSVKYKNGAVADLTWSFGFVVLALVYCLMNDGWLVRKILLMVPVTIWSMRLGIYIARRTFAHIHKEDTRYRHLREQAKGNEDIYFLWICACQAVLQAVVSLPFIITSLDNFESIRITEYAALALFVVAFIGETTADKQLENFTKRTDKTKKEVCKDGLWRYSRHPNYFFEWLIWCAWALLAFASPYGFWAISSPLIMLVMLLVFSGVKISEEVSLKSRGDAYRQYQKETSPFIPWFPKTK
ncbi:MAG: DUF1295 domain-containing protein [Candidatus Melainabacteria bacterium]|nr:DUF1295 domain-containing protein [Candidatus Melainabacteria bacterium]